MRSPYHSRIKGNFALREKKFTVLIKWGSYPAMEKGNH